MTVAIPVMSSPGHEYGFLAKEIEPHSALAGGIVGIVDHKGTRNITSSAASASARALA